MEAVIAVKRVYRNDVPEHEDIIRIKVLYVSDILSMEQAVVEKDYTTLFLPGGEEILVAESIGHLGERIQNKLDEEKTNQLLG